MIKKFKGQYAGKRSERFWRVINELPGVKHNELYFAGVLLQNMEDSVLYMLNLYIEESNEHESRKTANKILGISE